MAMSMAPRGRSGGRSPGWPSQTRRSAAAESGRAGARSSSVPAGVGGCEGPKLPPLGSGPGGYALSRAETAGEASGFTTPSSFAANHFTTVSFGAGSAVPAPGEQQSSGFPLPNSPPSKQLSVNDKLQPVENPLDENEDFVEGGMELSPKKADSSEERSPLPTQPLSTLEGIDDLRRFWPSGENLLKALFLDYDGTLRELEARPELAVPTPELMSLLQAVNDRDDFMPHIISGRDAKFLERYFGSLSRFTLIAEHGFQISTRPREVGAERKWELYEHYGGDAKHFRDHENWKAIIREEISRLVSENPGSHLEEKQSSLVWHYRQVEDEAAGEAAAGRAVQHLEAVRVGKRIKDVKISRGHKVVEASYRNVHKGLVMRRLCEEKALFGEPYAAVLAAGDDVSDETMFEAAPHDFLTVKVGQGKTRARFRVGTPQELRDFLRRIASLQ